MALLAKIQTIGDARRSTRKQLRLTTSAAISPTSPEDSSTSWMNVRVHDLSRTGLLIETYARIRLGDEITVELPECEGAVARVIWNSGFFHGCQFVDPLTSAVMSASLLKSAFDEAAWAAELPEYVDEDERRHGDRPLGPRLGIIIGIAAVLWALIIAVALSLWSLVAAKALSQR